MDLKQTGNSIGLVETSSIARGILVADDMMKAADVRIIVNRTICPGKYMVLVGGAIAAVAAAIEAGVRAAAHTCVDHFTIANVHPDVFPAISGVTRLPEMKALGVIEGFSVASVIKAADAAAKAANVQLVTLHLAMAIGGKAFITLTGDVAAVEAAVQAGTAVISARGMLVESVVIASPTREIVAEFI
jgi:microcompartment protein CcmL/EutN